MKFLWVVCIICGVIGFVQGIIGVFGAVSAPQQAAGAGMGGNPILHLSCYPTDETTRSGNQKRRMILSYHIE